jgi:hypothetical protein
MSEIRTPEREWRFYIDGMIEFAAKVLTYSADLDQVAFIASGLNYDAVLWNLELIGEPDIDIIDADDGQVKINGVDVFHPNTGEARSDGADGIACWFLGTDYDEESFFVRHAYFLGANDPCKSLKITLKAEINEDAWATLNSDTSRPFAKPGSGRIAVKVINHLGDEVMKVFRV